MSKPRQSKPSLAEFTNEHEWKGTPCWMCTIPERVEIEAARRVQRASVTVIVKWLVNVRGYDAAKATKYRVESHFKKKHHEETK